MHLQCSLNNACLWSDLCWGETGWLCMAGLVKHCGKEWENKADAATQLLVTLHFSFKALDWSLYAAAVKENQSSCPTKFMTRYSNSCDLPVLSARVVFFCFDQLFGIHVYWCVSVFKENTWILHGKGWSLTLQEDRVLCLVFFQLLSQWWGTCSATTLLLLCFF